MRNRKKPSTFNRILKFLADLSEKEKKASTVLTR